MKSKIIISVLFIMMAIGAKAQSETDNRERFQIGIKAGGSLSNVYDADGEEFKANAKAGFTGGLFLTIPLGRVLGLQPEVLFTQKGFRGNGRLLGQTYSFSRTSSFLDIPILVAIKPAEFLTIVVGPQYSYLFYQRDVFNSSLFSYQQEQEFNNDNIRKNMLGIVGGVDFNIGNFVIGGRIGMDLLKNQDDGSSDTPRYRNISGQLTLGYKFL